MLHDVYCALVVDINFVFVIVFSHCITRRPAKT